MCFFTLTFRLLCFLFSLSIFRNKRRLLHPGADTRDILTQYVSIIRCLRIVDPPGVLLFKVADPIRRYLRYAFTNRPLQDTADHLSWKVIDLIPLGRLWRVSSEMARVARASSMTTSQYNLYRASRSMTIWIPTGNQNLLMQDQVDSSFLGLLLGAKGSTNWIVV